MAPTRSPKPKREKVFHPESRKAGQLARKQLRISKLSDTASKRSKKQHSQVNLYGFFYHAIPPDAEVLALEEIHSIVRDLWLTRHDEEIEAEKAARRKGRPKSVKEEKLEEIKLQEHEIYRTGMEVPDLTHAPNVELFRKWDMKELAFIHLLRFIRISSADPHLAVLSRPGKHFTLAPDSPTDTLQQSAMEVDTAERTTATVNHKPSLPTFADPSQFGSTMLTMDGPLASS